MPMLKCSFVSLTKKSLVHMQRQVEGNRENGGREKVGEMKKPKDRERWEGGCGGSKRGGDWIII